MNKSAEQHLTKARDYVTRGEDFYRKAAEEIVAAQEADSTLSNREIGEWFGHGESWVRRIVRWSVTSSPVPDDLPFSEESGKSMARHTRQVLRDSTPEQVEEILSEPAIRANVSKALDRHYQQRAESETRKQRERQAEDHGGEEQLAESEHHQRLAEVVNVLRGAVSALRFAAAQAKGLELNRDDTGIADEMSRLVEEITGFGAMLTEYLSGQQITDEDIAQLIGADRGTDTL